MADIGSLADIIRQLEYKRAGGLSQQDMEAPGRIINPIVGAFNAHDKAIKDALEAKKLQLENQKAQNALSDENVTLGEAARVPMGPDMQGSSAMTDKQNQLMQPYGGRDAMFQKLRDAEKLAKLGATRQLMGLNAAKANNLGEKVWVNFDTNEISSIPRKPEEGFYEMSNKDAANAALRQQLLRDKAQNGTNPLQKQKMVEGLQSQLDELDSVLQDVGALRGKFNNSLTGNAGGFARAMQHIPIIGGTIAPDTKNYEDLKAATALNIQKALTKSSRALGSALKAETSALPDVNEPRELGASLFTEQERKLKQRANAIIKRIKSFNPEYQQNEYLIDNSNTNTSSPSNGTNLLQNLINKHANTP